MSIPIFIPFAIVVTLNAFATRYLLRSPFYDTKQKWLQAGIVWLLPVMGAILVWSLARETRTRSLSSDLDAGSGFDDGDICFDNTSSSEGGCDDSGGGGGCDGDGGGGGGGD